MDNCIKIREVSLKYDISARTLRYYEDMGLIKSIRSEDYAYRMYDETSLKRLEQILILRKLNITIKDIQKIFLAPDSSAVLEVLGKKVEGIDEEVALLHELKEIVLQFIHQIEKLDFRETSDIKLLYEKARELELRLSEKDNSCQGGESCKEDSSVTSVDAKNLEANQRLVVQEENKTSASPELNHFLNVTEKLKRGPEVRIIELPKCRMATSGYDSFDNIIGKFDAWWGEYDKKRRGVSFPPLDFLWFEDGQAVWWMAVEKDATSEDTGGYEIIDFEGGLYAAAISVDGDDDISGRVFEGVKNWLETSGFEMDERTGHRTMCHMIITDNIKKGLGYDQLDIYVPIKLRNK